MSIILDELHLSEPKELLTVALKRAEELVKEKRGGLAVRWRIKCIALTRIVYGDGDWRVGQAHCNLARAYLELKGQFK